MNREELSENLISLLNKRDQIDEYLVAALHNLKIAQLRHGDDENPNNINKIQQSIKRYQRIIADIDRDIENIKK